jgi:hypothetical protein
MWSEKEKDLGLWFMQNTRRDAGVWANGWHANTLMSLAGRLVTLGYGGWVWTHGLNRDRRLREMNDMMKNMDDVGKFEKFKIEYAVWKSDDDKRSAIWPVPAPNSRWILVADIENVRLYRLLKKL